MNLLSSLSNKETWFLLLHWQGFILTSWNLSLVWVNPHLVTCCCLFFFAVQAHDSQWFRHTGAPLCLKAFFKSHLFSNYSTLTTCNMTHQERKRIREKKISHVFFTSVEKKPPGNNCSFVQWHEDVKWQFSPNDKLEPEELTLISSTRIRTINLPVVGFSDINDIVSNTSMK